MYQKMKNALKYAVNELREWNPNSEAANEIEEILNNLPKKTDVVIQIKDGMFHDAVTNEETLRLFVIDRDTADVPIIMVSEPMSLIEDPYNVMIDMMEKLNEEIDHGNE